MLSRLIGELQYMYIGQCSNKIQLAHLEKLLSNDTLSLAKKLCTILSSRR